MTNTPTDVSDETQTPADDPATPVPADSTAVDVAVPEPVPFWQRPLVERFLVPLLLPIAVIVGLVAYILNISRIFLSAHGHIPVVVGTTILITILLGASLLSYASPRLRQSAITMICIAYILAIMSGGWIVLGHSQPEKTGPTALPSTLKTTQSISVTAGPGGTLSFAPNSLTAKTGLATIKVAVGSGGHTFNLQDPATLYNGESLTNVGGVQTVVAFFGTPGSYTFFCATPGHEAAGMKGTITVTGPPMTLTEALTKAGNPANAAG
jgi:plastocyanin